MTFAAQRKEILAEISSFLEQDDRFAAAWLAGSFGRGDDDEYSDLDLTIVVRDDFAPSLCNRMSMVHAGTIDERLAIIRRFGQILSIHENHYNAPQGGTFTNAIYTPSGIMVDWIFVPKSVASRPAASRLLFDTVGLLTVPHPLPPSADELGDQLSERVAFFWMLVFPTITSLLRGDLVRFHSQFDFTTGIRLDVERLLEGRGPTYRRDAVTSLLSTNVERIAAIREEAHRMESLAPAVRSAGGTAPQDPLAAVESRLLDVSREKG